MTYENFKIEVDEDGLWFLFFDNKNSESNVFNHDVIKELDDILENAKKNNLIKGLIFLSRKKDFILGTDINEITKLSSIEQAREASWSLSETFQKIANLPFTTVAAISGQCLGSGLELALACNFRIAANLSETTLALPEIKLGLIPAGGGTQRLPKIIGIQAALDMILTGRRVDAKKALKIQLIDACVPPNLLYNEASKYALKAKLNKPAPTVIATKSLPQWAIEGNPIGRKVMFKKAKEMIDEKTKGLYPASYKVLEAIFDGFDLTLANGRKLESTLFSELVHTKQAQALMHLFKATNRAKLNPFRDKNKNQKSDELPNLIGIIGAGLMGGGIATICANKDYKVLLTDPSKESIGQALRFARGFFTKQIDKRKLAAFDLNRKLAHISPSLQPTGYSQCDMLIEAVFEDLQLKQNILKSLEENESGNWIFATNTSAIPIKAIAQASKMPERVIGMHFFSPVEKMSLLELVLTDKTASWVASRAFDFGRSIGKNVITVKDGPGFYTTRTLAFFLAESINLLAEGFPIEFIDQALIDFGFPIGPIGLIDEVGIDVCFHVLKTIRESFPDRLSIPQNLDFIYESGRMGRKNNRGFYRYIEGNKEGVDQEIYELLKILPQESRSISQNIITDRCLLVLINESIRCLEENILQHPYDGDLASVFGLGFPPFWGGPFKYVDFVGATNIVEMLKKLSSQYGERFKPVDLLCHYAEKDIKFFPDEPWQATRH